MGNSFNASRGVSSMFSVAGLPMELKVSFWIWFAAGVLGLLGGVLGVLGSLVLFAAAPGAAALVVLLLLLAAAVGAAQVMFALRMKAGRQWARVALTVLTGVTLVLALSNRMMGIGQGGNWTGFLISLAATVLMWVPNSQAWFAAAGGNTSPNRP